MKKMNKDIQSTIFIISSFFIGCIVGIVIICCIIPTESSNLSSTIKEVKDSVVSIETVNKTKIESTGSGFIYKKGLKKAYILTNEHVIDNSTVEVTNSKGKKTTGIVLGKDKKLDIAVIEIDNDYAPKAAKLGNSNKVEIGEEIFVIGTPLSLEYAETVTKGIISGKNRTVLTSLSYDDEPLYGGIQFDAAVNPGSSGGPLFNKKGEVIGICVMKFIKEEIEGMGFAIPIEQAKNILKDLEQGKEIEKPELGITMVEVSNTTELNNYNIKLDKEYKNGIVVLEVKDNSNADNNLIKGDIIIQIDDKETNTTDDVKQAIISHKKGDNIKIKIIRNNKKNNISVTLE